MNRKIHIIDATGVSLGRVATQAAWVLMGKHKPTYAPNKDEGDFVKIKEYGKMKFTGKKMDDKLYYFPTTRPGKLKSEALKHLWARRPAEVIRRAVLGMLPKNSLRKEMIKRLTIIS